MGKNLSRIEGIDIHFSLRCPKCGGNTIKLYIDVTTITFECENEWDHYEGIYHEKCGYYLMKQFAKIMDEK